MKFIFKKLIFGLGIVGIFWGCSQIDFQKLPTKIDNFKGQLVTGKISDYKEQKGDATLIVLTATWCPNCKIQLPHLKNLSENFKDSPFKIILISEDDSPKIAADFNNQNNITWPTFFWNYELMNKLGNPGVIPVSYLVNAADSIVKINVGQFDRNELEPLIKSILEDSK